MTSQEDYRSDFEAAVERAYTAAMVERQVETNSGFHGFDGLDRRIIILDRYVGGRALRMEFDYDEEGNKTAIRFYRGPFDDIEKPKQDVKFGGELTEVYIYDQTPEGRRFRTFSADGQLKIETIIG